MSSSSLQRASGTPYHSRYPLHSINTRGCLGPTMVSVGCFVTHTLTLVWHTGRRCSGPKAPSRGGQQPAAAAQVLPKQCPLLLRDHRHHPPIPQRPCSRRPQLAVCLEPMAGCCAACGWAGRPRAPPLAGCRGGQDGVRHAGAKHDCGAARSPISPAPGHALHSTRPQLAGLSWQ